MFREKLLELQVTKMYYEILTFLYLLFLFFYFVTSFISLFNLLMRSYAKKLHLNYSDCNDHLTTDYRLHNSFCVYAATSVEKHLLFFYI